MHTANIIKKSRRLYHCLVYQLFFFSLLAISIYAKWMDKSINESNLVGFTPYYWSRKNFMKYKNKIIKFNLRLSLFAVRWVIWSIDKSFNSYPSYWRRFQLCSLYFNFFLFSTLISLVNSLDELNTRNASKQYNDNYEWIGSYFPKNEKSFEIKKSTGFEPISIFNNLLHCN